MKTSIILLIIALLLTVVPVAFAEEYQDINLDNVGLRFKLPSSLDNSVGLFDITLSDQIDTEGNEFLTILQYYPKSKDDLNALEDKIANSGITETEAEQLIQEFVDSAVPLMVIYTLRDEKRIDSLIEEWKSSSPDATSTKIGEAGEFHFYRIKGDLAADIAALESPYKEECQSIANALEEAIAHAEFAEPANPDQKNNGKKIVFNTTDLDGNPINSEELFAKNKITMINIWATWCPPCKAELPELAKIHKRLEEKNCAIVGILQDSDTQDAIKEAKSLLSDAKVDYLNLAYPQNFDTDLEIDAFPTSFIVDSNGIILGTVVGAYIDQYETLINSFLE